MSKLPSLPEQALQDFLSQHQLPEAFLATAKTYYLPLAESLLGRRSEGTPLLLGINGAQGTGKSTVADFLQQACRSLFDWNVAVLSVDDFYYTASERAALARDVHPLFLTRGVPGTHDVQMLSDCLQQLKQLSEGDSLLLPRFDKAMDDRAAQSQWPSVSGPIDLIILEGWCVGSRRQPASALNEPINALERDEDQDGVWRQHVNQQLASAYSEIYDQIDTLVFLKAPSFNAILNWRVEQEEKLAAKSAVNAAGIMTKEQIIRFILYYERLTRENLETLSTRADVVFHLDESHSIVDKE